MKTLPYKLLTILTDGKFHSGEELAQQLEITRSAVWKIIKQLSELGLDIIALKAKGYQIPNGLELLDKNKIENNLNALAKEKISAIEIFNSLDSTNQYLLQKAKAGTSAGSVCLAEYQTAGRGRRGRDWQSPFGSNIYLSLLWHFDKDPAEISGLSLAIAVGVVQALEKIGVENLQLKWPNDILWGNKKLAGVLLEMIAENHESAKVVIGIGLNLNMPKNSADKINQPWIDLKNIINKPFSRNHLISILLNELIETRIQFEKNDLTFFLPIWQKLDIALNQPVVLHSAHTTLTGKSMGVSAKGELLFANDQTQQIQKILAGEISLRLNTYI